jgi:lysozyme
MRNKALIGAALAAAIGGLYQLEGLELTAYRDIAGVPTICAGTTGGVRMGQTATPQQCWDMTVRDYQKHEKSVLKGITVPLNVNQQTALTFFCYNVGDSACMDSTAFRKINAGDYRGGCQAMALFNKVTVKGRKVVSKGLINRRSAEVNLCLAPLSS